MELWNLWLDALRSLIDSLALAGLGLGGAIVVATVLIRVALLPISWRVGYAGMIRKRRLDKLGTEIERIKVRFAHSPERYFAALRSLHRRNGLKFFDGRSLLGSLAQIPIFLGMYRVLSTLGEGVRFLWVSSLGKPDILMALLAAVSTALMMALNPDLPQQLKTMLILVPALLACWAALQFGSALAVYWTVSNALSMLHTAALHSSVERRIRTGKVEI